MSRRSLDEIQVKVNEGDTHAFYTCKEWKDLRPKIIERDNNTCQRCLGKWSDGKHPIKRIKLTRGTNKKPLQVHHIVEIKDDFSKCLDANNLVTLCHKCHDEIHDRDITKYRFKRTKKYLTDEKW